VQRRPEPVPAPGEVGVDRGGPQSGVDPDEQQADVGAEQIVDGGPVEGLELGAGEARRQLRPR
jgi:hypothetical protein